jgi:hypothetical protein
MAWRTGALRVDAGEPRRRGSATFVWASGPHTSTFVCGPHLSRRRKLLVRASSQRRGGNLSCEAESPHAGRKLLVYGGNLLCEAVASRESHILVGDESSCQ